MTFAACTRIMAWLAAHNDGKALANGLGQWEKATAFLGFIQRKCPQHPQHSEIQHFLEQAQERQPLRGPKASFNIAD